MPVIKPTILSEFVQQIFQAAGATEAGARLVAGSLVKSNLVGHDSHGIVRVRQYLDNIAKKELDPAAEPIIVQETAAITQVDACYGFGQVAAHFAMNKTIEKAQSLSLAATGLLNCNHVGRLGEWVQMAADQGLIGLAFCNGGRPGGLVAPHGGAGRLLGTNPLAAAVPVAGREPFVMDFATSAVAEGKVRVAKNKGLSIPEGWILDAQGRSSTNPDDLYNGGMLLPTAGHKGYGLALLIEFLGGVLTGQGGPWRPDCTTVRNGVIFIVLAAQAFRPIEDFLADGAILYEKVKATPAAPGFDEVMLPGEPEQRTAQRRQREGIRIDETTWGQLKEAATGLGVAMPG
jgi:LDH2 family malate/lactate/ureidoglycolate dehydrogenase